MQSLGLLRIDGLLREAGDHDVWAGSRGVVSHMHYDLQHNLYHVLYGRKAFLLAPMGSLVGSLREGRGKAVFAL